MLIQIFSSVDYSQQGMTQMHAPSEGFKGGHIIRGRTQCGIHTLN